MDGRGDHHCRRVAFRISAAGCLSIGEQWSGGFSQGGELSFDSKSISLKSSVTGVVILTLSLAFFIAYVKWVYPIKTQMDPEVAATNSNFANAMVSNVPMTLSVGGAGAAPGSGSHPAALSTDERSGR
jgi:hypothetical protein